MPKKDATTKQLQDVIDSAKELQKLFAGFVRIAERAPPRIADKMKINGLGTLTNRLGQAVKKAREFKGKFENWAEEIEAANAEAASSNTKR